MDDAGRVRVAEMILEVREMQARLRHLAIDERAVESRTGLEFVISDLETAVEHLLREVANRRSCDGGVSTASRYLVAAGVTGGSKP